MAVDRVERLLRQVTQAFNAAGIEYAVFGGNALAAGLSELLCDRLRHVRDTMEWFTEPPDF